MVIGNEINNLTLDGIVATDIQFNDPHQLADILNFGPGGIYVSWRRTAIVGDVNCLMLPSGATPDDYNIMKIVGGVVVSTLEMPDYFLINGDATGMQASILFEGGAVEPPQIVLINQAMSGGM